MRAESKTMKVPIRFSSSRNCHHFGGLCRERDVYSSFGGFLGWWGGYLFGVSLHLTHQIEVKCNM